MFIVILFHFLLLLLLLLLLLFYHNILWIQFKNLKDLSTFNYSLSKHSIWDQCVNRTDINTKKLNDLIEVYENDLFVCNNSKIFNSIRYLNLKTFKGLCVKEDFDTARTSFKVNKINIK